MPDSLDIAQSPDTVAGLSASPEPDSLSAAPKVPVNALEVRTCHEVDAPRIVRLKNATLGRVDYAEGVRPEPRAMLPGYDSGVMAILVGLFLVIALNLRHYSTFIKTFAQDLFSVRRRANVFDANHTMSETRVLLSLVSLACFCEGILLFSSLTLRGSSTSSDAFVRVGLLSLLAMAYYGWQVLAYRTVGYLFTSGADTKQWLKGFNASQSLLGLALVVPALLSLFNPALTPLLLSIGVFLYGVARIIFISKGFRIFYENYASLVYFILYLCTLEIAPPVMLYRVASYMTANI